MSIDHNLWNYIYFLYNVKRKDHTEYTGVESFVREQLDNQEITWVPIYRALQADFGDENKIAIDDKLEQMTHRVEALSAKLKTKL